MRCGEAHSVPPFCQEAGIVRLWLPSGSARERDEQRDNSSSQRDRGREGEKFQDHLVGHGPTLPTEGRAEPLHLRPIRVGHEAVLVRCRREEHQATEEMIAARWASARPERQIALVQFAQVPHCPRRGLKIGRV